MGSGVVGGATAKAELPGTGGVLRLLAAAGLRARGSRGGGEGAERPAGQPAPREAGGRHVGQARRCRGSGSVSPHAAAAQRRGAPRHWVLNLTAACRGRRQLAAALAGRWLGARGLRPRSALLAGGLRPAGWMPRCVLGLGSNLGNRAANLHRALRLLRETVGVRLERTSLLYDSSPQYVTEQPRFLNATCEIITPLPPHELLRTVKVRRLPHRRAASGLPPLAADPADRRAAGRGAALGAAAGRGDAAAGGRSGALRAAADRHRPAALLPAGG